MPLCCSNPPCGDLKQCVRPNKSKKSSSSSSSGKPIPLNKYIKIQTEGFQLKSAKNKKKSSSSEKKSTKKSKKKNY